MSPFEPQIYAERAQGISHEQVALRAYSKWLERGCPAGDSETDWFEALQELEQEQEQRQKQKPAIRGKAA